MLYKYLVKILSICRNSDNMIKKYIIVNTIQLFANPKI